MRPEAKKAVAESADCRIFHWFFFAYFLTSLFIFFFFGHSVPFGATEPAGCRRRENPIAERSKADDSTISPPIFVFAPPCFFFDGRVSFRTKEKKGNNLSVRKQNKIRPG